MPLHIKCMVPLHIKCTVPLHTKCTVPLHIICTVLLHIICTVPLHMICTVPLLAIDCSFRVHFTPQLREHDVGVMTMSQWALFIPPGATRLAQSEGDRVWR
jgi:hypothetical protein